MFIDSAGYSDLVNSSGMTDMISQTNCSFCDKSFPFPSFVDILPSAKKILEKSSYITTESLNTKKLSISVVAAMTVTSGLASKRKQMMEKVMKILISSTVSQQPEMSWKEGKAKCFVHRTAISFR